MRLFSINHYNPKKISDVSTPQVVLNQNTFLSVMLKCRMNFSNCSTSKKRDFFEKCQREVEACEHIIKKKKIKIKEKFDQL